MAKLKFKAERGATMVSFIIIAAGLGIVFFTVIQSQTWKNLVNDDAIGRLQASQSLTAQNIDLLDLGPNGMPQFNPANLQSEIQKLRDTLEKNGYPDAPGLPNVCFQTFRIAPNPFDPLCKKPPTAQRLYEDPVNKARCTMTDYPECKTLAEQYYHGGSYDRGTCADYVICRENFKTHEILMIQIDGALGTWIPADPTPLP